MLTTRRNIGRAIRERLNALAIEVGADWRAHSFFFDECLATDSAHRGFVKLMLLVDPGDLVSWRAGLGLGDKAQARRRPYARVRRHCEENALGLADCLEGLSSGTLTVSRTNNLIPVYEGLRDEIAALRDQTGRDLVDALFPAESDCDDIRELALDVSETQPGPADLLDELRSLITQPEIPSDEENVVKVMTLHKSKGLTAEFVVVAGCVDQFLPTLRQNLTPAEQAVSLEEQRRLFYVAVTRAAKTLVISGSVRMPRADAYNMGATRGTWYGDDLLLGMSPFVTELGPRCPRPVNGDRLLAKLGLD